MHQLQLQLPFSSRLEIENSTEDSIWLQYITEGEYGTALHLQHKIINGQLQILEQGLPSFDVPNDKLSVHKIFAATVKLRLPKYLMIHILFQEGRLIARGNYKRFSVEQQKGQCELIDWNTAGQIRTVYATVVLVSPKVRIEDENKVSNLELQCGSPQGAVLKIATLYGKLRCAPQ